MSRKNVLLAASAVVAVIVLALGGVYFARSSDTPVDAGCQTTKDLIKYSDDKMADIAKVIKENDEGVTNDRYEHQDTTPMYREWADKIRNYADSISDSETKAEASTVAGKADDLAKVQEKYSSPVPDAQLQQAAIEKSNDLDKAWDAYKAAENRLRNKCHMDSNDPKL
ncbi:hypothetical protein PP299_06520 [Mycobacteroides abscessus]|nr:hypothetical protein [Mycobacteroides abscessus]MDM1905138.1 hypothetical protein [Mycobacteroides abscessus]MDM1911010.1 hypothetical protein [Mycobacteroides abscessus]MDM1919719.1 hypothetical protein [Mycobacteroides abscessus]